MAIIYSYPLNQPKRDDLLIGTITYDENAQDPVVGNPTVSFTVGSLLDLVAAQGAAQNLQQVTNIGNTTTNSIVISNSLKVAGGYYDSSNQPGTAGQLLSSTATGTQWVNVAAQGVTSVGLLMPAAFTVANSPITQSGTLTVTGAGTAAQYINGLGNLVTFPTIPTPYVLPVATTVALGGIKIGYTEAGKNYPLELDNEQAYVNVPWTDTVYSLPLAADGTRGGVQIGYTANAKNYPVELSSEKMFVNVPWTDTTYTLPVATATDLGGVKIGYTENNKNYPVELDSDQMYVNVPWTDTQNPFQTITGTGSNNTDSGVLLSNSGGTVLILGSGSVTAAQSGNTIMLTGTDTGITGVTLAIADSTGAPLSESITNRELTLTSHKYVGGANVGYVPEGGTGTTYLKGDGTWASIPTGLIFKGVWDASGTGGGNPDLTSITPVDGWLYIVSVAGSAEPNGVGTTPNSWNIGDWCVFDGTNWTRVPSSTAGVTSLTTTDGTYIDLTPAGSPAAIGNVTVTADLSAQDGTSDTTTRFLSKDNTWDVPSYTTNTNTQNIYTNSWQQSTDDIILRKVLSGAGSGTQDIKIVKGANITFTYTDANNFTIAATDTQENTTWYVRDANDDDKTVNNLKYLKFVTATGALGTALTGAGSTSDPYIMTLTSPDTNTQNTYTAGAGLSVSNFVFSADIDTTAASSATNNLSTDTGRYYAVQLDNNSTATDRKMVVNVPWSSGGTYNWTIKDNATNPASSVVDSGETIQFVTATGPLGTVLTEPSAGNFVMTLTSPNTTYSNFTAASSGAAGASGLVVAPPAGAQGKFLRGDATWVSETTYSTFTGADGTNAGTSGLVPAPAATDNVKFLKGDGTWAATPQGDITEIKTTAPITGAATSGIATIAINTMGAATANAAGTKGAVPAPAAGDQAKFLRADATWEVPTDTNTNTTYTIESADSKQISLLPSDVTVTADSAGNYANVNVIQVKNIVGTIVNGYAIEGGPIPAGVFITNVAVAGNNRNLTLSQNVGVSINTPLNIKARTAVTLADGTGISIAGNNDTITITNVDRDTGLPAIIVNDAAGNMSFGNGNVTAATVRAQIGAGTGDGDVTASSTTTFTNKSGSNSQWTNDEGYTTNTGTTTADNTQTFTNKSGSNSQWTNDEGYTTNAGTVTPSSTDTFTNKSGSNSQWTNDEGYTTNTGTTTADNTQTFTNKSGSNSQWTNDEGYTSNTGTVTPSSTDTFTNKSGNISMWTNDSGYLTSYTDNNYYVTGASFNTGNGVLSITGNNAAVGATVDLDGRYLTSYTETDTLATVTGRGATTGTACSFTNTTSFLIGGSGSANLYLGNIISPSSSDKGARFHSSNNDFYMDFQGDATQNWFLRDYDGIGGTHDRFGFNFINGTFTATGDVVAFGSPSDIRLKENIKPIKSALDKAMKLQGVTFDWKENNNVLNIKEDVGFIAQDVQKVMPELVRENKDGMLSMRHQGITPILLEAIKELKAEIEELKSNNCNCNK